MKNNSKILHCKDYNWVGIEKKTYKTEGTGFKGISRFSLLGSGVREEALNFHTRYFEVSPAGYSSLEFHKHPHTVIVIRGSGSIILGDEVHDIGLHDVVYISPDTIHQFHADKGESLGFLCIVDRYRDKPQIPDQHMLDEVMGDRKAQRKARL